MKSSQKVTPTRAQIRAARSFLGWSQKELGEPCGLTPAAISLIENGETQPMPQNLERICVVFWDAGIEFTDGEGMRRRSEVVEILEGMEGIIRFFDQVYETISAHGGEILVSGVNEAMFDEAQGETAAAHIARMTKLRNFTCKTLIRESDDNPAGVHYAEYRKVPDEMFSNVPFYLYGTKLAIILWSKVRHKIILLHDPELTEAYRKQFYFIWKHGRPAGAVRIGA